MGRQGQLLGICDRADRIADMTDIFQRWKPAGTSCRFVIIDEDSTRLPGARRSRWQLSADTDQ